MTRELMWKIPTSYLEMHAAVQGRLQCNNKNRALSSDVQGISQMPHVATVDKSGERAH